MKKKEILKEIEDTLKKANYYEGKADALEMAYKELIKCMENNGIKPKDSFLEKSDDFQKLTEEYDCLDDE